MNCWCCGRLAPGVSRRSDRSSRTRMTGSCKRQPSRLPRARIATPGAPISVMGSARWFGEPALHGLSIRPLFDCGRGDEISRRLANLSRRRSMPQLPVSSLVVTRARTCFLLRNPQRRYVEELYVDGRWEPTLAASVRLCPGCIAPGSRGNSGLSPASCCEESATSLLIEAAHRVGAELRGLRLPGACELCLWRGGRPA